MEISFQFLATKIAHNTVSQWLIASAAALIATFVLFRVRALALALARRVAGRGNWEADLLSVAERTRSFFLIALGCAAGLSLLDFPPRVDKVTSVIVTAFVFLQIVLWADRAVMALLRRLLRAQEPSPADTTLAGDTFASPKAIILSFLARFLLYVILLLLFLDNLGVNITALVTGLGVGGVAVALAVQNILGDLFASLSIAFDKPFEVGDFIVVGEFSGTVEKVGLKTTRVKSISGEQVIIPNSDLLQSRVRNFKRMRERRVVLRFGVTYETPADVVARIPGLVRDIVETQGEKVRFDRSHFASFAASSLDFEVVYFVLDPEYSLFMDIQQTIGIELMRAFAREHIEFAYPTQTLYLRKSV